MLGTISLEVNSFIDSDLTWKGSKGKRSSLRRAKKSFSRSLKDCGKLVNQYSKTVDMPVSESEKLGVSVLGCRFSEKAEHVPIKKRRFVYRSPSPPPRARSPHTEKKEIKPRIIDSAASANDLGQIVDSASEVDETNLERVKGQVDENEDFSGISILAAAACGKDFGGDGHAEDNSGVEESFVRNGPFEGSTNNQSCFLSKGVSKNDLSFTEMSTKGTGSCVSALPAKELAVGLRTDNSSADGPSHADNVEDISVEDHSMVTKDLASNKDEGKVGKQVSSSRDDRLHWDLNTVMDSWEHPFDYHVADSETNAADNIAEDLRYGSHCDNKINLEGYEVHSVHSDPGDGKTNAEKEVPPSNSIGVAHEIKQSNIEEHNSDVCANAGIASYLQEDMSSELDDVVKVDQLKGKESLLGQERIQTDAVSVELPPADDDKKLSAAVNEDKSTSDHSVSNGCVGSNEGLSSHRVDNLDLGADNNLPSKSNCDVGGCAADAGLLVSSGSQVEKQEVAPVLALSVKTTSDIGDVLNKAVDDVKGVSGSLDHANAAMDVDALETGQTLEKESTDGALENFPSSPPLDVEMPTSGASNEVQPALAADLKAQVCLHDSAATDTSMHNSGEEPTTDCVEKSSEMLQTPTAHSFHDVLCRNDQDDLVNSSDRMVLEEPLDNGYYSDVSHDHAQVKSSELLDYDSQYEDGEVRESIVHTWEEYDGEDMEAEHVDYGSDNANNLGFEAEKTIKHTQDTDFQPCLSGSSGSGKERTSKGKDRRNEIESGDEAGADKITGDVGVVACLDETNKPSLSAEDHKNISDALAGMRDGSTKKNLADDCVDVLDGGEVTADRAVRSREFRRELPSHIEGRISHDEYLKDDKTCPHGSSDADHTNSRSERERGYGESFARCRYNLHAHARGQGNDWVNSADSHRVFKRYRSPNYHGPTSFRRLGPENGSIGRQKIDASSVSIHRRLTRSGSPIDRGEAFRLRLGFRPSRELSPGRRVTLGRGRSLRYGPRVDGRGLRGRYHRPIPDDCSEPSLNRSHPSAKRERSFSPNDRRGEDRAHNSLSKSPSRSRTRFPDSGNPSLRHRSKSPNFRSEVRMQRGRSPHQRPGFLAADRMVGFRTMHRSHGSPPHNSRWISDCKDGMVHGFNQRSSVPDRRSPGRFGPRDDRFDLADCPRNHRPMHPGRFSEMDGIGRGRIRCEESDENREKYSYRFGPVAPAKRYEMDVVKQFRYSVDDGFVKARNSRYGDAADFHGRGSPKEFGRGIESRIGDASRRFREERGPFVYQRDGKYNINSKSFGLRENDEEITSRRRPS